MRNTTISRRQFLVAGSTVTGSLVMGLPVFDIARADLTEGTLGERQIGYFVEITPAGKIIIGSNQPEIGQGLRTALPMMVAEDYSDATMKVEIWQKDMAIIADFARSLGCPTPLFNASAPLYTAALAAGRAKQDTAAVHAVLGDMAGLKRKKRR